MNPASSVGKKQIMAVTGLIWTGFLIFHLLENVGLLINPQKYNEYAHFLISLGPVLWVAEAVLLITLLVHMWLAVRLTFENKRARPQKYAVRAKKGESNLAAETMIVTGVFIAFFVVWHLISFKYGTDYRVVYEGKEIRDLHRTVMECFASLWFSLAYIVVMGMVGLHLSHGFQSAFQSLGLDHPGLTPMIRKASLGLGWFLGLGFALIALIAYLQMEVLR